MAAAAELPPSPAAPQATRAAGLPPADRVPGREPYGRWGLRAAALCGAVVVLAVPILTACGSSPARAGSAGASISATCTAVGAALSDGPDPDADPVGYAAAQIRPLRAIQTSDQALRAAVRDLAAAYARIFASNDASAVASKAATAAAAKVNAICPGAAS
jgi:hypothetical protein